MNNIDQQAVTGAKAPQAKSPNSAPHVLGDGAFLIFMAKFAPAPATSPLEAAKPAPDTVLVSPDHPPSADTDKVAPIVLYPEHVLAIEDPLMPIALALQASVPSPTSGQEEAHSHATDIPAVPLTKISANQNLPILPDSLVTPAHQRFPTPDAGALNMAETANAGASPPAPLQPRVNHQRSGLHGVMPDIAQSPAQTPSTVAISDRAVHNQSDLVNVNRTGLHTAPPMQALSSMPGLLGTAMPVTSQLPQHVPPVPHDSNAGHAVGITNPAALKAAPPAGAFERAAPPIPELGRFSQPDIAHTLPTLHQHSPLMQNAPVIMQGRYASSFPVPMPIASEQTQPLVPAAAASNAHANINPSPQNPESWRPFLPNTASPLADRPYRDGAIIAPQQSPQHSVNPTVSTGPVTVNAVVMPPSPVQAAAPATPREKSLDGVAFALAPPTASVSSAPALLSQAAPTHIPLPAIVGLIKDHTVVGKRTSFELALSPEELGKIRLFLQPEGDKLRIVIQAERPETMELLRRNTEGFSTELRQAGFSSTSFSFGGWDDSPPATRIGT